MANQTPTSKRAAKPRKGAHAHGRGSKHSKGSRSKSTICGGLKRNGKICGREPGWGTEHPGTGNCKHHGGSTPGGIVSAARQQTEGMGMPLPVSPAQSIAAVMHLAAGRLAYCTMKVAALGEDQIFKETSKGSGRFILDKWIRLEREYAADLARYCKNAADMGVQERQMQMAEMQTNMIAAMLEAVVGDLDLTKEQRSNLGPAIRRHMATIDGSATEVIRA